MDERLSNSANVALKVNLDHANAAFGANIQRRQGGTVEILFSGKGASEPDELRRAITPLLDDIAAALTRSCNGR